MGISVSGLASGLDIEGIISQLLAAEQRPILALQRRIAEAEARRSAYNDLDGRLNSLRTASRGFNDSNLFGQLSASSSDSTVVGVTVGADAAEGSYSVEVLRLAVAHRIAAQGFVDDSGTGVAAVAGTFEFSVGDGATKIIDVNQATTLRQLADAINSENAGVRADIVNDGTATNPYRLVLTSESEGADGAITISNNDTTLDFAQTVIEQAAADADNSANYLGQVTSSGTYTGADNTTFLVDIIQAGTADGGAGAARFRFSSDGGLNWDDNAGAGYVVTDAAPIALSDGVEVNFTNAGNLEVDDRFNIDVFNPELDTPQDALLRINGIQITQSSNTVTDVFPGITLTLKDADPGRNISISVTQAVGDVQAAMTNFIGAYNSAIGFLSAQFAFDPVAGAGKAPPALNGDSAARQVQGSLRRYLTGRLPGLSGATLSALSEIGVSSDEKTGLISLDTGKLSSVLASDPTAVERLLTRFGESVSNEFTYVRRSSKSMPGEYAVNITSPRTRGEVAGGAAAQVLAAPEQLTIGLNSDATNPLAIPVQVNVNLQAGDTADTQVSRINQAFADNNLDLTAFLDAAGQITVRSVEHGADYEVSLISDTAAGAGTSNIGNAQLTDAGSDLAGTIGGRPANVLDGTHLKGEKGYDTADIELDIPNDTSGALGKVRISDGVGESLPDLINTLTTGSGILKSRTDGISVTIDDLQTQVERQLRRVGKVEERLRKQFTNLEVTLGRLQSLGDYVSLQMSAIGNSRKR